jgi:TolA-binding protein
MRSTVLLLMAALAAPLSCAVMRRSEPVPAGPEVRLEQALVTLDRGDYGAAAAQLERLYQTYPEGTVGKQALLSLAASRLDPRNPARDLPSGAALLAQYLGLADTTSVSEEPAEVLYLLALELGAAEQRADHVEAAADSVRAVAREVLLDSVRARTLVLAGRTRALPQLPGAPVTARIRDLEMTRDSLNARVRRLQAQVSERDRQIADKDKQLEDTQQELARIRRILKP